MNRSKTEELVRRMYCLKCLVRMSNNRGCFKLCNDAKEFPSLARKFVKEENIRKANEVHMRFVRDCRKHPIKGTWIPFNNKQKGK